MRILSLVAAAVAALLVGCQICEDGPRHHALSNEPLGARCDVSAECASGLACLEDFCTLSCSGNPGACPGGSACVLTDICLPGCASDADCLMGSTVGRCTLPSAGSAAYCFFASCGTDDECPPGSTCVDASEAKGITWGSCATGWCQR
jgi:hypothetical protein